MAGSPGYARTGNSWLEADSGQPAGNLAQPIENVTLDLKSKTKLPER